MTNAKPKKRLILVLFLLIIGQLSAFAGDYYWINGAGNWNDSGHWSNTSGGSPVGSIPGEIDRVFIDENSGLSEFSIIEISANIIVGNLTINTPQFASIHGGSVDVTIKGSLVIDSPFGIILGGELIFDNTTSGTNYIETFNNEFYTDLVFKSGTWELKNHLKTSEQHVIKFNSGKIYSKGFSVHAKDILANNSPVELDFTGSHVLTYEKFDIPEAINIGGTATYMVLSAYTSLGDIEHFTRDGDDERDAIVSCVGSSLELELLITSDYNGEDISCFDSCDGEITVNATGTPGPFSYRYGPAPNPFGPSNVFSDLCVGSHSVTVQDSSNQVAPGVYFRCTISDDLTEPPVLSFDPPATIHASCPGVCDGQAFTFPTGGTAPLSIFWPTSGETGPNPTALCIGDNTVEITDANGCMITDVVEIMAPPELITSPTITPPTCNGDCDAIIELNPTGGNGGPYTIVWSPDPASGPGTNPGDGFCAGAINVEITDIDGCAYDTIINVIDPPVLTVSISDITDVSCFGSCDGQATANPVGGFAPYSYEWFDDATGLTTGITDPTATGLCPGDYYVVITDDLGCIINSSTFTIGEPDPIILDPSVYETSCFGVCDGSAAVDVTGGTPDYTYSWTTVPGGVGIGATDSISGLCPGEYQIVITDDNGCVSSPSIVEVTEPTEIIIDIASTNPSCYDLCDGSAIVTASGGTPGYSYTWSPTPGAGDGTPTPSDMCADTYTVTVTDDNGCDNVASFTLTLPDEYDISSTVTDLACFGDTDGAIDIIVNSGGSGAGYTYTWSPTPPIGDGSPNVGGLTEGTWSVTISDSEFCDTTLTFTITSPSELIVDGSVISHASCNGECNGSAEIEITGGTPTYSILWDDPLAQTSLVASDLCADTYTVTVTDDNGCVETETITINEPAPFDLSTSQTDLNCFGDCDATATVTVLGGGTPDYSILWDDPLAQTSFTAIGLCAGTYNATITDDNGCDTIVEIIIIEPDELIVNADGVDASCFGDCTGAASVEVIGGTPPYSYEWYNAATDLPLGVDNDSIFGLCPGDYYAIVTDDNGCITQSIDITITEDPEINIDIISTTDAVCAMCDGTAEISVSGGAGGFIIDWTPDPLTGDGTTSVTGLCAGTYTVNIIDANGCEESSVISIDDIVLEVLDLDSVNVTCHGGCDGEASATWADLDGPYTLEWFDNATGLTTGIFGTPATGLCAGEYLAVLTNASGCTTSEVITIIEPDEILGPITTTDASCNGACDGSASITVTGGVGPYTYDWGIPFPGSGEGTPNASGLCPGPWQVDVTDDWGCTVTFTTIVDEPDPVVLISETSTDVTCVGDDDGTATVIADGGTPPYTYEWFDCATGLPIGQTGPLATGLPPGSYECVITDDNGCNVTSTCIPVADASDITAIINIENISCYGDCDGLIWAEPSGGSGTYFYQWLDEFGDPILGQTDDSLENVCQGFYNLEITDLNGCSSLFGPIDMTAPSSPWDVMISQTDITCAGDCDGTATVVVLDGNNPPYTYLWDDPLSQTTPTANFLCEGTWSVTISDAGVCDTTISFNIVDNDPLFANMTDITHVDCFGECTGEITVNPIGGMPPYTLNWSDGQTGDHAIDLCSGPITLSITDALGCNIDTTFTINEATEITTLSSFSNNTTCGECNGSATVNVSGGTPGYDYDWTPDPLAGEGTNNATGLCPGVVSVTITDANGCELVETFGITDVPGEDVTVVSTDESCFGACDGTAEAIYVCSDPTCTQEWYDALTGLSTGITSSSITGLCEGEYFVEVINGSGCTTVESVIINSKPEIFANEIITPITCNGSGDGTITVSASGGSGGGYTYGWSPVPPNGDGTNEALDLGPGIWELTITDGDGCSETFEFELIEPAPIIIDVDPNNTSCHGECDGSILANASGGAGGFTFQWFNGGAIMPGETSPLLAGICPGNYNVIVTDANGCTSTLPDDVTISEPIEINATLTKTDVSCFGECDGTITTSITGGVAPYSINWYDAITGTLIGPSGPTATGLCPGSYYAVITDNNGCNMTTATIEILEPTELSFTISSTDATCEGFCDGTADIVVSGGTPPYSYEWLTIFGDPIVGGTAPSVIDLCEGNYTVEVTDANGCTSGPHPVVIDSYDEINATVFTNEATCNVADGSASVFASGGNPPFTYQWFDDAMSPIAGETDLHLIDVFAGVYFVTVTDDNGCQETFTATISDSDGPEIVFDAVTNPTCFEACNGSIEITATGVNPPFVYSWNPDGIIAEDPTGLCAGEYTLEVTDDVGCKSFADTTLFNPSEIIVTADITSTECGLCNGSITINPTGGTGVLNVLWNTGSTDLTISDLCSGVYEVLVTDENGCTKSETFTINNSEGLTADPIVTAITCSDACDGTISVNASGGTPPYTYEWLHDGSTSDFIDNLCEGVYFVEITDATGCTNTVEIELNSPNPISAEASVVNPNCGATDGSITVISEGGTLPHTYSWNTGDPDANLEGVGAGIYILTITDDNGCTSEFTYGLSNLTAPFAELITTDETCYGACDGTIDTLSIVGGTPTFNYEWFNEDGTTTGITTPLIENLCSGDYLLEISDAAGCVSYSTSTITSPDSILINPLFANHPLCADACDGLLIVNPIGGTFPYTISWDDPLNQTDFEATDLCAGVYTVTVEDANGCIATKTETLIEPSPITIVVDSILPATCQDANDGNIYITISGGTGAYDVQWVSETLTDTLYDEDPSDLMPMDYYLEITDENGCTYFDTLTVDTLISIVADAGLDTIICYQADLILVGTSNIADDPTYSWYNLLGTELSDSSTLVIENNAPGTEYYVLTVEYEGCIGFDTVAVVTADQIIVDAGEDIEMYSNQEKEIGGDPTAGSEYTIEWTPIDIYLNDPLLTNPMVIEPDSSLWYYVVATDTNGCSNLDSVFVEVLPDIVIPDGITPGSDGKNDTWILEFLEQYPGVPVKINVYNRWGDLLFESDENYQDDWAGTTIEGKRLPAGTYYYVIEVDHEDFPDPMTGPLTIMW
ncbi:T9SS type B sorting domain-containing protein [Crocinitomix algicola]|uniref:T9SS type B sorting domain-containing protein n=1 Tax=Crocinitomix algicola TaxID=1740263 RepID=UPI000836C865|nr:gliding motility-associated C-terminal domain-containing protein [Crocinitomix algicola]